MTFDVDSHLCADNAPLDIGAEFLPDTTSAVQSFSHADDKNRTPIVGA